MNKKLHVLFLCGWFPSRVLSNNGDFIQRHAEAVALRHKVTVFHIISDQNNTKNIEIVNDEINDVTIYIAYIKPSKYRLVKLFRYVKAFQKLLRSHNSIDIIHLNEIYPFGLFSWYLKKRRRIPYVISEHWTGYLQQHHSQFSKIRIKMLKILLKNSSLFCPVSHHLKNEVERLVHLGHPYHIVPNVVDTKVFRPNKSKNATFSILHISNMKNEHKNLSGLIETVAKFKEKHESFKLKLLGEQSIQYKSLVMELGLEEHVEFLSHLSHKEVVSHIQQASILVLFSNYENLPCVILESFACGTPVVSTDVGGIHEFFPKDFGRLISKNDQPALLDTFKKFYDGRIKIADKDVMHQYAIDHFSPQIIADSFSNIYYAALKSIDQKNKKI